MKFYKLTGVDKYGKVHDFGLYNTEERARNQMQTEIVAYTWKGKCDWEFFVEQVETREFWKVR